jgi:4-hydroxy-4-methyl-2-oxoglutarate aldolase
MRKEEYTNAVEILRRFSTPIIYDTMSKGLSIQFKHQAMASNIKPISPKMKVCGPAYTVRCYPGATWAMEIAVAKAPKGSVLVCDAQGSDAGVIMGELMSTFALKRGIQGAVIDGAVRDVEEIIEIGFQMFARHITPRNGVFEQSGNCQQSISCGGVLVKPNDIICGDVNGVIVIPQEIISQVMAGAIEREQWEQQIKKLLIEGNSLEQASAKCKKPNIQKIQKV